MRVVCLSVRRDWFEVVRPRVEEFNSPPFFQSECASWQTSGYCHIFIGWLLLTETVKIMIMVPTKATSLSMRNLSRRFWRNTVDCTCDWRCCRVRRCSVGESVALQFAMSACAPREGIRLFSVDAAFMYFKKQSRRGRRGWQISTVGTPYSRNADLAEALRMLKLFEEVAWQLRQLRRRRFGVGTWLAVGEENLKRAGNLYFDDKRRMAEFLAMDTVSVGTLWTGHKWQQVSGSTA